MKKRTIRRWLLIGALCAVLATLFVLLLSPSTSPLYGNYYGGYYDEGDDFSGDSAQFQTVGKAWLDGKVPFRDIFDHKGPVIFLVNALGYAMGGRTGITILQIISLTITLFIAFKLFSLFDSSFCYGVIGCALLLILLSLSYGDGNNVQEYALPFIFGAVYYIMKYFKKNPKQHNHLISMFYGFSIGFCLLDLAICAIPIICGAFVIVIDLVKKKEYANIWKNVRFAFYGFLAAILPFAVYFLANGAFYDFIFATFIFNIEYTRQIGSWLTDASGNDIRAFFLIYLPYLVLPLIAVFAHLRKEWRVSLFALLCFAMESYFFLVSRAFLQYAMISVINIPLLYNEMRLLEPKRTYSWRLVKSIVFCSLFLICFDQLKMLAIHLPEKYHLIRMNNPIGYEVVMDRNIEKIRRGSFQTYGCKSMNDVYLKYKLTPDTKYFTIQGWHIQFDENVRKENHDILMTADTEYILTDECGAVFEQEILERYEVIDRDNEVILYELKH